MSVCVCVSLHFDCKTRARLRISRHDVCPSYYPQKGLVFVPVGSLRWLTKHLCVYVSVCTCLCVCVRVSKDAYVPPP